jgi:hypothetical protein
VKRTLPFLIAMVMTIVGWVVVAPSTAGAAPERPCVTYTYDAPAYDAPGAGALSERGPPVSRDRGSTYNAVHLGWRGSSVCPGDLATSATPYAYPAGPAQAALAIPTTGRHLVLTSGDSSSLERSGVAAKSVPEGVVYKRTDLLGGKPYVGQAKSEGRYTARQSEHARANPDADFDFEIIGRANPGTELDRMEEFFIRGGGGPTNLGNPNGGLSNLGHQMSDSRYSGAGGDLW